MRGDRYAMIARQLQHTIDAMEDEQDEISAVSARTEENLKSVTEGSTWTQRNAFFSWLRNDREVYERRRPLRGELRRLRERDTQLHDRLVAKESEIRGVIGSWLEHTDPGYRELLAAGHKAGSARAAASRVRSQLANARRRIEKAKSAADPDARDETARMTMNRDAGEVAESMRQVAKLYEHLRTEVRPYGKLHHTNFPAAFSRGTTDYRTRIRELQVAGSSLRTADGEVAAVVDVLAEKEKTIEGQLAEMIDNARAALRGDTEQAR